MQNYLSWEIVVNTPASVYERIEESRDRRLNHPPGSMVDVGGYHMHLYCIGQGSPTVVMEAGLGDEWLSWHLGMNGFLFLENPDSQLLECKILLSHL